MARRGPRQGIRILGRDHVFAMRRKGNLFTSGPDRWLVLAGAGLLVLGLVLRLLTDIGRSTAAGDTATPVADRKVPAAEPMPAVLPPTTAETLAATPSAPEPAPAPVSRPAAPREKAPAPAVAKAPATSGWGVQLGAFGQRANAERLQSRVRALGYQATIADAGALTRVRVNGLADRAAAQAAADAHARTLGTKGVVVSPGR
jgi:cell division protein FtsN